MIKSLREIDPNWVYRISKYYHRQRLAPECRNLSLTHFFILFMVGPTPWPIFCCRKFRLEIRTRRNLVIWSVRWFIDHPFNLNLIFAGFRGDFRSFRYRHLLCPLLSCEFLQVRGLAPNLFQAFDNIALWFLSGVLRIMLSARARPWNERHTRWIFFARAWLGCYGINLGCRWCRSRWVLRLVQIWIISTFSFLREFWNLWFVTLAAICFFHLCPRGSFGTLVRITVRLDVIFLTLTLSNLRYLHRGDLDGIDIRLIIRLLTFSAWGGSFWECWYD